MLAFNCHWLVKLLKLNTYLEIPLKLMKQGKLKQQFDWKGTDVNRKLAYEG